MRYSREAVEQTYIFTHRSGRKFTVTAVHLEDAVNQYHRQAGGDDYMCVEVTR
jgi:hypothetical protein